MLSHLVTFGIGAVFALGFGFAGLTDPATIVNFLDFTGAVWDPTVAIVMITAVAVTAVSYRLMFRTREKPVLAARFSVPTRRDIDKRLVSGALVFGFGWGFTGLCPGPALAASVAMGTPILAFLGAMFAGMYLFGVWDRAVKRRAARTGPSAGAPSTSAPAPGPAGTTAPTASTAPRVYLTPAPSSHPGR